MNWFKRLTGGLNKTASGIKKSIGSIFKGNKLDVSKIEDLEDQLISCDIGIDVSEKLVSQLKSEKLNSDDCTESVSDVPPAPYSSPSTPTVTLPLMLEVAALATPARPKDPTNADANNSSFFIYHDSCMLVYD